MKATKGTPAGRAGLPGASPAVTRIHLGSRAILPSYRMGVPAVKVSEPFDEDSTPGENGPRRAWDLGKERDTKCRAKRGTTR